MQLVGRRRRFQGYASNVLQKRSDINRVEQRWVMMFR